MNAFKVGDNVEALDEFGVWAKGKVVAIEQEMFSISFDGFGSMWDHWVSTEDIRRETTSQLPTKRSRQPTTVSFLHAILSILIVGFFLLDIFYHSINLGCLNAIRPTIQNLIENKIRSEIHNHTFVKYLLKFLRDKIINLRET